MVHNLYSSPNVIRTPVIISRTIIWLGYAARMEEMRNACQILFGKREWKILLGGSRTPIIKWLKTQTSK
jgi:hypothetical protein